MFKQQFFRLVLCFLISSWALVSPPSAEAKQCVFNKGGYVLHVNWYRPADLVAVMPDMRSVHAIRNLAPAVQTAVLTAGFGDCTKTNDTLVAFLSVPGCAGYKYAGRGPYTCEEYKLPFLANGTPMSIHHLVNGNWVGDPVSPIRCGGSDGLCMFSRSTFEIGNPSPASTLMLVIAPPATTYLDFVGTFLDVEWKLGGPIN